MASHYLISSRYVSKYPSQKITCCLFKSKTSHRAKFPLQDIPNPRRFTTIKTQQSLHRISNHHHKNRKSISFTISNHPRTVLDKQAVYKPTIHCITIFPDFKLGISEYQVSSPLPLLKPSRLYHSLCKTSSHFCPSFKYIVCD